LRLWIRQQVRSGVVVSASFLALSMLTASSAHAQATAANYTVGQTGSLVGFTISGKVLLPIKREGRFKDFNGELSYDPAHPADTRVNLTVYTSSVDMHDRNQDQLLRSADFFDTDRYPTMHFAGSVEGIARDGSMTVSGDLTIRGITKRVSAPVIFRASDANSTTVFETNFQIDRTDFGLNGTPTWGGFNVSISKKVQIHIAIAAVANPAASQR